MCVKEGGACPRLPASLLCRGCLHAVRAGGGGREEARSRGAGACRASAVRARARTHAEPWRRRVLQTHMPLYTHTRTHAHTQARTQTCRKASASPRTATAAGSGEYSACRAPRTLPSASTGAAPAAAMDGQLGWNACEFARLFVRLFPCKPCKGLSKCRDRSGSATDPAPPFHCPPPRARQAPRTGPGSQSAVGCEPRELRPGVSRHLETSTHLDISPGPRVAVAGAVEHQPETWCAPNGLPRSTVRRCCAEIACGVRVRCLL